MDLGTFKPDIGADEGNPGNFSIMLCQEGDGEEDFDIVIHYRGDVDKLFEIARAVANKLNTPIG